jgi:hypothetical protein
VPRTEGVSGPRNISRGDRSYPAGLIRRFGADAPTISVIGPSASLSGPITAFLCSKESPGATILKALDQAVAWRDAGRCVISGFHSPLERECLNILLRGTQPIVKAAARAVRAPRLPAAQRRALNDGRLTIVSPFSAGEMRTTKDRAFVRNLFIAAMAEEVVFAYVSPGGSLSRLLDQIAEWRVDVRHLHE